MPYSVPHEATTIRSAKHGEFRLDILSVRVFEAIAKIDRELAPREYTIQALHVILLPPPQRDIEALGALPDRFLGTLIRAWAKDRHGLNKPLRPNIPVFAAFQEAMLTYISEETKRMEEMFHAIASSYENLISPISKQLAGIVTPAFPSLMSPALQAMLKPSPLLKSVGNLSLPAIAGLNRLQDTFTSLSKNLNLVGGIIDRTPLLKSLQPQIASLQVSSYWTKQSLEQLSGIKQLLAANTGALDQLRPLIVDAVRTSEIFSSVYRTTLESMTNLSVPTGSIESDLIAPAQTTAVLLGTVKAVGTRMSGGIQQRETQIVEPVQAPQETIRTDLARCLGKLQPRFALQWQGAWDALRSTSPDRLRQAAHSGRELLAQVLSELAPDTTFSADEIKQRGSNGRVTRKMRVAKALQADSNSTRVELIESMAKVVDHLYGALSAKAHDHNDEVSESEVSGFLLALDGILVLLLSPSVGL